MPEANTAKPIGLVLFNGFALAQVASVLEMFESANTLGLSYCRRDAGVYDVSLLSISGGRISSSSSVFVWTESIESRLYTGGFHALFVAGGADALEVQRDERLIRWLRREGQCSKTVVPIGDGRLLMEAANLKHVGSGWTPALRVMDGTHYVTAGEGLTRSVGSPLCDARAIIEHDFGGQFAREAATRVVRCNQPASFSGAIRENASGRVSAQVGASVCWMEANSDRPITIDEAAQVAAMSERNFLRRFKVEMGVTPSEYLLYVRIDMCCRLLNETDLPVDKVARRCGFGSGGRLAKVFRKHLSTTPMEYRENGFGVRV